MMNLEGFDDTCEDVLDSGLPFEQQPEEDDRHSKSTSRLACDWES